jgi:hypothetical protein
MIREVVALAATSHALARRLRRRPRGGERGALPRSGVRGNTDVEGEIALANMNHELAPDIETVFIPAHPELSEVSSSKLKELATRGMDVSRYCPAEIVERLNRRAAVALAKGEGAHV